MKLDIKNRDITIDALKAFLALGVLFFHCVGIFGKESVIALQKPLHYTAVFRVPAFYFISGYILCNQLSNLYAKNINHFNGTYKIILRKLHQLIVPAIFFTLFPSFEVGIDALSGFHTIFYFLPSLFTMILFYCLISLFLKSNSTTIKTYILCFYALTTTFLACYFDGLPNYFTPLHWDTVLIGNIFFILGVLTAMHKKKMLALIKTWWFLILFWVIYSLLFNCIVKYEDTMAPKLFFLLHEIVAPCFGIYAIFSLFLLIFKYIDNIPIIQRIALYLSQRSLAMYVMQSFAFAIVFACIDVSQFSNGAYISLLMYTLSVITVLLLHDLVILIPGINKYLFGRTKSLITLRDVFKIKSQSLSYNK